MKHVFFCEMTVFSKKKKKNHLSHEKTRHDLHRTNLRKVRMYFTYFLREHNSNWNTFVRIGMSITLTWLENVFINDTYTIFFVKSN